MLEFVSSAVGVDRSIVVVMDGEQLFSEGCSKKALEAKSVGADDNVIHVPVLGVKDNKVPVGQALRKAAASLVAYLRSMEITTVSLSISRRKNNDSELISFMSGLCDAAYTFTRYKSKPSDKPSLIQVFVNPGKDGIHYAESFIGEVHAMASAKSLCKDLVNTPGSDMSPPNFISTVIGSVCGINGVEIKYLDEDALHARGLNGHKCVGKGSRHTYGMLALSYNGAESNDKHLAFVGKGITFDTGGMCLKPSDDMWEMRSDMAGAATVAMAFKAIASLKYPVKVTAILCVAENSIGPKATLPGDIITGPNGITIKVENTDAEGRLVLMDGLAYAGEIGATHIIDVATLTGSIVSALGSDMAGGFTNDDDFLGEIISAAKASDESIWHMPLNRAYDDKLKDSVADIKNIGGGSAGSITAALFLNKFVPDNTKWAHLDIAGPAYDTSGHRHHPAGASGWGVEGLTMAALKLFTKI